MIPPPIPNRFYPGTLRPLSLARPLSPARLAAAPAAVFVREQRE